MQLLIIILIIFATLEILFSPRLHFYRYDSNFICLDFCYKIKSNYGDKIQGCVKIFLILIKTKKDD